MEIKINPKFRDKVPPLQPEEYNQLEENIVQYGCREPLVIWNNFIVDGHNRYEICTKHNIPFKTKEEQFESERDAIIFIIKNQLGRRNISAYQRAVLALEFEDIFAEKAKENLKLSGENFGKGLQNSAEPIKQIDTRQEVAKLAGLSHDTIMRVKKIQEKATPEMKEQLTNKDKSINEVFKEIRSMESIEQNEQDYLERFDDIDDRLITPYGENIFFLSTKFQNFPSSYKIIKKGDHYPTLKRRSWFYHEDGREFSLREYARVQTFPDDYKFVGGYEQIKDQIGNAVAPEMAKWIGAKLDGKTFGDLFAGCGGLSCGLEQLGKKSMWAIERNVNYARTYKVNSPNTKVITRDIRLMGAKDLSSVDLVVGGPPCQGFSLSGKRFADDPRNEMYKEFVRIVRELKPKEFLMENVLQIREIEDDIIRDFSELGYKVETHLVRGEDIGMRQHRNRYFFIGRNGNN